MFATLFHECGLAVRLPVAEGRNGPCSVMKPDNPEHPGPPFVHKIKGSIAGAGSRARVSEGVREGDVKQIRGHPQKATSEERQEHPRVWQCGTD